MLVDFVILVYEQKLTYRNSVVDGFYKIAFNLVLY